MLKPDGNKRTVSVVLESDIVGWLDDLAEINGRSRSYVINVMLKAAKTAYFVDEEVDQDGAEA